MFSRIIGRRPSESATEEATEATEAALARPRVGMVVDMADANWVGGMTAQEQARFAYSRPEWLYLLSEDELAVSADQATRPVLTPKDPAHMPLHAGYAETINAGKTTLNEDQASAKLLNLVEQTYEGEPAGRAPAPTPCPGRKFKTNEPPQPPSELDDDSEEELSKSNGHDDRILSLDTPNSPPPSTESELIRAEAYFFGLFDGHAGTGAALMASNCLHEHVRERLSQVLGTLIHLDGQETALGYNSAPVFTPNGKRLSRDDLVIGALETAFVEMDDQIAEEKMVWRIPGGCASVAALFLLGKLYVANAGDCRALLVTTKGVRQLSNDLTPDAERKRLQLLAFRQPDLTGKQFTRLEYNRHLSRKDLRKKVLYRDWYMDGWALKTVRDTDLRPPLISDGFRKVRLLNTIGVTRGFGDHHLMTLDDRIPIKPFLSPVPEVRVVDLSRLESLSSRDVLVLASDGLWDVLSNAEVASVLDSALAQADESDVSAYTLAAQDLVIAARGDPHGGRWHLSGGDRSGHASSDDISVFVIPLKYAIAPPTPDDDDEPLLLPA